MILTVFIVHWQRYIKFLHVSVKCDYCTILQTGITTFTHIKVCLNVCV